MAPPVPTIRSMRLPNGDTVDQLNRPETALVYREIFVDRCYMPPGTTLAPGDVVVDVGANVGMASLFFLSECPGVEVYALEPAPLPYEALVRNLARAGGSVRTRCCAVSWRSGSDRLTYYPGAPAMSGLYADPEADAAATRAYLLTRGMGEAVAEALVARRCASEQLTCELITLSQLFDEEGIDEVACLKLDCEGSELDALRGIRPDHWPAIRRVAAEVAGRDGRLADVVALLERNGLDVTVTANAEMAGTGLHLVHAVRGP